MFPEWCVIEKRLKILTIYAISKSHQKSLATVLAPACFQDFSELAAVFVGGSIVGGIVGGIGGARLAVSDVRAFGSGPSGELRSARARRCHAYPSRA
jgi:hypothetical protein